MSTWKHADVNLADRLEFDGNYKAYDDKEVEITSSSKVYFKLRVSEGDEYRNDFGGNLSDTRCVQFAEASDGANLRVDAGGNVSRIALMIGAAWNSFYPV